LAANWTAPVHKLLEQLVSQMVEKGIHYEDALREFDRRFIVEVMDKTDGNLSKAADTLGVHRNTLSRKIKELKIKTRPSGS
ncbi:MAG: helix-turn-helix domain-containing protein, partial [Thermoanaerobaculia bacterium]